MLIPHYIGLKPYTGVIPEVRSPICVPDSLKCPIITTVVPAKKNQS